jgi:hypothetical protein
MVVEPLVGPFDKPLVEPLLRGALMPLPQDRQQAYVDKLDPAVQPRAAPLRRIAAGRCWRWSASRASWSLSGDDDRQLAERSAPRQVKQHLNPVAIFQAQQAGVTVLGEMPEHVAAMTLLYRMLLADIAVAVSLATGVTLLVRRRWINAAHKASLDGVKRGNHLATTR